MIRPARLTDLPGLNRPQHLLSLDLPNSVVREFSPAGFAARSALGPLRGGADCLLYTHRMRPIAACYYDSPGRGEEASIVALSAFGNSNDQGTWVAWERLAERTCLRAAGDGKLRVVAKPEEGSELAGLLHKLGFTIATRERVLVSTGASLAGERQPGFEPLRNDDVWDVWKLYSRTEPVVVQRAEGLTPASWLRSRKARRKLRQEWLLRVDGNVVVHTELMLGQRSASISFHYEPAHRDALPAAILHLRALCARRQIESVYCVVREHQAELEGLLLDSGFESVRQQVRLVLYTSVLAFAGEPMQIPATEKAAAVWRGATMQDLSGGQEHAQIPGPDWYNYVKR